MAAQSWGVVEVEERQILHVANDAGRMLPVLDKLGAPLDLDRFVGGHRSQADTIATIRRVLKGCGVPEADLPPMPTRPKPHQERYFQW